jgi:hypothetical protein
MIDFDFLPETEQIPAVRRMFNIGALLDIPTGSFLPGRHGESILNAGVGNVTGVVGIGNNFKSTVMLYMMFSAASRFPGARMEIYDTEINVQERRLNQLAQGVPDYRGRDLVKDKLIRVTDKSQLYANEWYEKKKDYMKSKVTNSKKITVLSPFLERDGKSLMPILYPTFNAIDSFTEFETDDVAAMQANNELGDSGANTIFMKQGQSKTRFLQDIPKLIESSNNPMFMTAHIGKVIGMDPRAAPVKKLQHLKNGDVIKGVTDKFLFLTTTCWQCQNAAPFFNDTTRGPEYPRDSEDNVKGDSDLNILTLNLLRNKNGPSGIMLQLLVSQQEGVLPSLSEFHYIKVNDRYGISGTLQNYALDLLPDVRLSRTSVRGKIDKDPQLVRALNITSEMCQMYYLCDNLTPGLMCSPKQLYDDLIAQGYDWNILLNTRGWWTANNDNHTTPFLSTMDLLNMRAKTYHPYWLEDDKRTIKVTK